MRTLCPHCQFSAGGAPARRKTAFTLVEMMMAMGLFSLVTIGLVYTQLFGLSFDQLVNSKLGASDTSRRGFDQLTGDIREAKLWAIGTGSKSSFIPCGNATNQVGNAIQLSYTTDTNSYVRYYFDTVNMQLCRLTNGMTAGQILAENLTNVTNLGMTFHAEWYNSANVTNITSTEILQDLVYKYVIVTTLEFAEYRYPLTKVGPGYYYNYYRIQLKAASHCPN